MDEMIIKIMSGKFWQNYWHGYVSLKDELWSRFECSLSESRIKRRVKYLRESKKLEVRPTFDDSTGLLNGSGYFITTRTSGKQINYMNKIYVIILLIISLGCAREAIPTSVSFEIQLSSLSDNFPYGAVFKTECGETVYVFFTKIDSTLKFESHIIP